MKYIFNESPDKKYKTVIQKLQEELPELNIYCIMPSDPFDLVVEIIINNYSTGIKTEINDFNQYNLLKAKVSDFVIKNKII